ncbi:MAG: cupin domain-containing protein, partial [Bdellovibrionota bacterium]
MAKNFSRNFKQPDERRPFQAHGHLDIFTFDDGVTIGKAIFEPGWKWSNDVKPIAGTATCEASHSGYCMKGKMTVRMNDGTEIKVQPGDAFHIPPGHDAWVEGTESCEMIDVGGFASYAKKQEK